MILKLSLRIPTTGVNPLIVLRQIVDPHSVTRVTTRRLTVDLPGANRL